MTTNVHDEHYRKIEGRGVEPIEVQETIMCNDIPPELHAIVKRNFSLAQAAKYMMRCGEKDQPEKELAKAQNYIHRAMHGCWSWQAMSKEAVAEAESWLPKPKHSEGGELPKGQVMLVGEVGAELWQAPAMAKGSWALDTTTIPG